MKRRFLQLDVFSPYPGAGNPLAVVLDSQGLDDKDMQAIARWTGLPETSFVFPPTQTGASYALRMFSPQAEVPFAGHPSIGTAHAVVETGIARPRDGVLVQEGITGMLPLRVDGAGEAQTIAIRTPRARIAEVVAFDDPRLRDATRSWRLGERPPVLMDGGRRWWLMEIQDESTIRSIKPDWGMIAQLAESTDAMGVFAYAPADVAQDFDFAVRAFVGNRRRFEDAASGAANAVLAAWLDERDVLPHPPDAGGNARFTVSQGREVGFDAQLALVIDKDGEVWSGGQSRTLIRGELDW